MTPINPGDVCVIRRYRITVKVLNVLHAPPPQSDDFPTAAILFLEDLEYKSEKTYYSGETAFWFVDELVSVKQLCEEYSDFMTFTASVMNIAPKDQPMNNGLVQRFWNLGRQARLHLIKWNVKEEL